MPMSSSFSFSSPLELCRLSFIRLVGGWLAGGEKLYKRKFVIKIFHFTPLRDLKNYSHATLVFRVATDAADDCSCYVSASCLLDVTSMRKLKIVGITKDHKIS